VDGNDFTNPLRDTSWGSTSGDLLGDSNHIGRGFPALVEFEGYWVEPVPGLAGLSIG